MAKIKTVEEMAKEVSEIVMNKVCLNDMPLEDFVIKVNEVLTIVKEKYDTSDDTECICLCGQILKLLNAECE
jgi:hypothetical protein